MPRALDTARRTHTSSNLWHPVDRPPQQVACADVHKGPHNRCAHTAGYHHCPGDTGCPYLIADLYAGLRCPWHSETYDTSEYRELMQGGRR